MLSLTGQKAFLTSFMSGVSRLMGGTAWLYNSLRLTPGLLVAFKRGPFDSSIGIGSSAGLERAKMRMVNRRVEREFRDHNGRCMQTSTSSVVGSLADEDRFCMRCSPFSVSRFAQVSTKTSS